MEESNSNEFIRVENGKFILNQKPYKFTGMNYWYGMNLGATPQGQERLIRELDFLHSKSLVNLRVMGSTQKDSSNPNTLSPALEESPGEYASDLLQGLDFLLSEMGKRGMKAVICLNNFWDWSGGFSAYLKWAGVGNGEGEDIVGESNIPQDSNTHNTHNIHNIPIPPIPPPLHSFYSNKKAMKYFRDTIGVLVNRRNSVSGVEYKKDPTIMSWEICNEPRLFWGGAEGIVVQPEVLQCIKHDYINFLHSTAEYIHKEDNNHLVCTGTEGTVADPYLSESLDSPYIHYSTVHLWVQNWGWYDPQVIGSLEGGKLRAGIYLEANLGVALDLCKPLVLEEFGIGRDGGEYGYGSSVEVRNSFFRWILEFVKGREGFSGSNAWAFAGEGRAREDGGRWVQGDMLLGDPPHEPQGWYSIYTADSDTIMLLSSFA